MDVKLAVLADYAIVSQDGKLSILGIFQEFNPLVLPHMLPQMYLVLSFEAQPAEYGENQLIRISLWDGESASNEILALEGVIEVPQPVQPESKVFVNQVVGLSGITFERAGNYTFSVLVEGEEKVTIPLRVNELK